MKLTVDVDMDEVMYAARGPAIVGPAKEDEVKGHRWVLYLPGQYPCICDSFEGASAAMREYLVAAKPRPSSKRRSGR